MLLRESNFFEESVVTENKIKLRKVGIFHYTPESAASKLNDMYDNPMEWWFEPTRQKVVKKFNEEFSLTSDDWLVKWKNEFVDVKNVTLSEPLR